MERRWDMEPLATKYWHKIRELEKQLTQALKRIEVLEVKNLKLREENLQLRIENAELKELLFGKPKGGNPVKLPKVYAEKPKGEPRPPENYRRKIPEKIDGEEFFELEKCPDCAGDLKFLKTVFRYIEEIPSPIKKTVKKENIGIYFCQKCQTKKYGKEVRPGSKVVIGENAKKFILYSYYLNHLTFGKIVDFLKDGFQFAISEGEIQNILSETAEKLEPKHLEIRKSIRSNPVVQMDETGWNMNGEKYYAWEMVSGENVSFELKDSRGKGVAEKLLGKNFRGTLMSDFYPAYKKNIPKKYRSCLRTEYEKISKIYEELKDIQLKSLKFREKELGKFQEKIKTFARLNSRDPPLRKLKNLKKRILQYEKELLVSLSKDGIPLHNNHAEQALRPLVIKRKISFGSRSKKALKVFAINMSVLATLWRTDRKNFFQNLAKALA